MPQTSELTSPKEIQKQATERRGSHSARVSAYGKALHSILGDTDPTAGVVGSYSDGRPALRVPSEQANSFQQRGAPNFHRVIVDDMVALRGKWPKTTVLPASSDKQDVEKAVLLTRALREQHDHSSMQSQQAQAAFFLAGLGDVCYVLDVRTPEKDKEAGDPFRPAGVYWTVINPMNAFPKFSFGAQNKELEDLFCIWTLSADEIKDGYDITLDEEEDSGDVIYYYSRTEKQIVVAGKRIAGVKHNLGFVPAEWVTNGVTDGRFAQSDVIQSYLLHDELQDIWKVYVDTLIFAAYPITHIRNRHNVATDQVEVGPGAQVETIGDGDIQLLSPQANPQAAKLIFESAVDNIMKQAGMAPIRLEGEINKSNVSGRSVAAQQAPMEQRVTIKNLVLGEAIQRLNAKTLQMLYKVPELKNHPMELYGQDQHGTYRLEFKGDDVGGWIRNTVKFDTMADLNRHERVVVALQLYKEGQGQYPWSRVLEEAGEDDPKQVIDAGIAEVQQVQAAKAAQQQGQGQPGPQGAPAPGQSNPQQAAADAMKLSGGGVPQGAGPAGGENAPAPPAQPPTPPMPPFAPMDSAPTQSGVGTPAQVPDVLSMIQEALSGVPLHESPQDINALPSGSGLLVLVKDHRDVVIVKKALAAVASQITPGGRVEVKVVPKGKA